MVLTPSEHHLLDTRQEPRVATIEGVTYDFISTPAYRGNGLGRILNMMAFTWQLARKGGELAEKHGRPAMIIASSPHPYAYLAAERLAHRYGSRCIFEVRDLWPLSLIELAGVSSSHPLVRVTDWLERRAYRNADAVVSLLPCTRAHMVSRGLAAERWHYIPNGVEIRRADIARVESEAVRQARHWRSEGKTVVVYTGALGRPNHVESLVRAMAMQRDAGTDTRAAIVGRGELETELAALISQLQLQDRVVLLPQIPKAAVLTLLEEVDIGFISLRPEPLFRFGVSPNKLFDYMLAGLPVIFAVQAGNDPVAEAGCGFSVNPGQPEEISAALSALAKMSPSVRREMGRRGRDWVEQRHGYASLARDYLALSATHAQ